MPEGPFKIELSSVQDPQQSLDKPPGFSVRITNVSDEPVWLVGVLPGSEGLRYPRYTAEIEGPSGPVVAPFPQDLDYFPGLQVDHFVQLAPGESFDPQRGKGFIPIQQLAWFKPAEPGTYRLRLHFDATAEDPREWLGHTYVRDQRRVELLLKRVPKVEAWSNTLEIKFG